MRATRVVARRGEANPRFVPVRRVGTGDQVRFDVTAHDPSTHQSSGDELRCVYNHGNGLREVQQAYIVKGTCNGQTSYLAPGRHTSRVRVADDDGASAKAEASVMVVRRDVISPSATSSAVAPAASSGRPSPRAGSGGGWLCTSRTGSPSWRRG